MKSSNDTLLIMQYQSKTPVYDILKEFGISSRTMYTILKRHGIPLRRGARYGWSAMEDAKVLYARWNGATGKDFEGCVPGRSYGSSSGVLKTVVSARMPSLGFLWKHCG